MKVVLLGSGNVATHLAKALKANGEEIVQIYSKQLDHAALLANLMGCQAVQKLNDLNPDADLYIIAVKDDVIAEVALALKNFEGLVVHTSGTTDLALLSAIVKHAGVFYPLQTFSKAKDVSFEQIPICIEANDEDQLAVLKKIASKLSRQVHELGGDKRRVLHLAAVFASNFPNHLYALANQILEENNLDFQIIRPLIAETAEKVMFSLPNKVQTGPAIREDENTINKHLEMLKSMPELQSIYQSLSESIKLTLK